MKPVWLLDIDGVVNACTPKPDRNVWPLDQWRMVKLLGFPCQVATPVVEFIRDVHESGRVEIRWHTTWQNDAQKFADTFGLPTFPVAASPEWDDRLKARVLDHDAPWWKRPAAWRVLTQEQRPLIWTDDDITYSLGRRGQDEMRALGPALLIGPNERTGLTPKHLRQIGEFLDLHSPVYPSLASTEGANT